MKTIANKANGIRLAAVLVWLLLSFFLLSKRPPQWVLDLLKKTYFPLKTAINPFENFHFCFLIAAILLTVLTVTLAIRFGTAVEKNSDRILFSFGLVFAFAELYKQTLSYWVIGGGTYPIVLLPWQFCSLPIYLCLVEPFLPQMAKRAVGSFLSLFGTVGGYLVLAYPSFPESLTMCVYTMIWHILMVLLGAMLLTTPYVGKCYWKELLSGGGILAVAMAIGTGCNLLFRKYGPINLFYMSPYEKPTYLIVKDVYRFLGWGPSLFTYWLMFVVMGATPLFFLAKLLQSLKKGKI